MMCFNTEKSGYLVSFYLYEIVQMNLSIIDDNEFIRATGIMKNLNVMMQSIHEFNVTVQNNSYI